MRRRGPIARLISGAKATLVVLWLLGVGIVALQLVTPHQVGALTNLFQGGGDPTWARVNQAILLVVAAQLALAVLAYANTKVQVRLREGAGRALTLELFRRLLHFSPDFFRENEVEKINTRALEDSKKVTTFWIDAVVAVPLAVLGIAVYGTYMVLANWFLGLCMIPLAGLSAYFLLFDRQIQSLNQRARQTWDSIRVQSNEIVTGVSELRSHHAFDYGLDRVNRPLLAYRDVMGDIGRLQGLFHAAGPLVTTAQNSVLYWVGAALCMGTALTGFAGALTWGDVIAFLLVANLFREPVNKIAMFLLRWRMAGESIRRVDEYLQRHLAMERVPGSQPLEGEKADLVYDSVQVTVPSGARILRGLSVAVEPGKHVALVGSAGCGKSTAVQLLIRETSAASGQVRLGGAAVEEYDVVSLAREIGFVSQRPILLNTSIRNNLLLGLRRPSSRSVEDSEGSLDIKRLHHVKDLRDLERELVRVVKAVGFEADVVHKFLDNLLPEVEAAALFRERIATLRWAVQQKLADLDPNLVELFQQDRLLTTATVRENLVGVGQSNGLVSRSLIRFLEGSPIVDGLLRVGKTRLFADRNLAARTVHRSPALLDLLPAYRHAKRYAETFAPGEEGAAIIPTETHELLIEIALEQPAHLAAAVWPRPSFEQEILDARTRIVREGKSPSWTIARSAYGESLTVRENLIQGRVRQQLYHAGEMVDAAICEALAEVGLFEPAVLLGLEYQVGENGKFLSGGQRQKVALARVLLKNPSILVLDEATASLDELSQARVVDLIRTDYAGKTVVAISHRLSTIRDYDQIVVLDRGRVVQTGSFEELAKRKGLLRELLGKEGAAPPLAHHDGSQVGGPPAAAEVSLHAAANQDRDRESIDDSSAVEAALASCAFFANLRSEQITFVERVSRIVGCPGGTILFRRGEPGDEFFVVLEGEIEFFVERAPDGEPKSEVLHACGPGEVFGELAIFGDSPRTLGARTKNNVRLCVLRRDDLLKLIHADPQIGIAILETVCRRAALLRSETLTDPGERNAPALQAV